MKGLEVGTLTLDDLGGPLQVGGSRVRVKGHVTKTGGVRAVHPGTKGCGQLLDVGKG